MAAMVLARYKERISGMLQRAPALGVLAHYGIRLVQARFTVGAVGVMVNDDGEILLLKHVYHPRIMWGLPGGYVARRENPAAAVEREIREETGLKVKVVAPLWVGQGANPDHIDLAYLCRIEEEGAVRLNSEILELRWVSPADLPELLSFHHRAIQEALAQQERTR
jgi:8-oxo-dGTP diphosphatase